MKTPFAPVRSVLAAMARGSLADAPDAELLRRFAADRDGPAFAELVRRYGPLVWRVARTTVGHAQAAEDVFQATFLILAKQAAAVRKPDALAGWLHRTAHRAAIRARQRESRSPLPLPLQSAGEDPLDRLTARELLAAVDEEIDALPEALRAAVVLCGVEGLSQEEAAKRLGWSAGSVKGRLERARARLRKRLEARGLTVPAALVGVGVVPPELVASTLTVAGGGETSPAVAKLVTEVSGMNLLVWLKTVLAGALAAGGLVVAAGMNQGDPLSGTAPKVNRPEPQPKPAARPAGPNKLLVWRDTGYLFITPDGKQVGELPAHPDGLIRNEPILSPDGKRVAFTVNENPAADEDGNHRRHLLLQAADGKDPGTKIAVNALNVFWTPDGRSLVAVELLPAKELKDRGLAAWLIDPGTAEKKPIDLPKWVHPFAAMPGGKVFVGAAYDLEARKIHLALIPRDGKEVTKLTEIRNEGPDPKVSPDGTKILFQDFDPDEKPGKDTPPLQRLFLYDLTAKKRARLAEVPLNALVVGFCWSPDGRKVAYTWRQTHTGTPLAENTENTNDPKLNTETESFLVVADADGTNPKMVLSGKANRSTTITVGAVDWR